MSLKRKILAVLLGVGALYATIDFCIERFLIMPLFRELERDEVSEDLERFSGAITREIEHLSQFCFDWSAWDATYEFVLDQNAVYLESNLVLSSFTENDINLIYILDTTGHVVWGEIYNLDTEEKIALQGFPLSPWALTNPLLQGKERNDLVSGLMLTLHGPLLVAARPILPSQEEGEPRGTLVMGRFLTEEHVNAMREMLQADLHLMPIENGPHPESVQDVLQALHGDYNAVHYHFRSDYAVSAYRLYPDTSGKPALILSVRDPRQIVRSGLSAMRLTTFSTVCMGLFVLLLLAWVLNWMVSAPLERLTNHVANIDRSTRMILYEAPLRGDEIGALAREFNRMVRRVKRDIAEREAAEAALFEMRERVLKSEHLAALGEMGASVAHEIRNPLAGIQGAAQVMLEGLEAEDAHRPMLEEMLVLVLRCERTIRQLLDYAKHWEPKMEPGSPKALVEAVSAELGSKGRLRDISLTIEGDAPIVPLDRVLMQQVLWNLMENAIQAMPGGGSLRWRLSETAEEAVLELEDTGTGLMPGEEESAFKPFFTTKVHGTGLGLAICRRIVEAHGGSISLEPGEQGALVRLRLPKEEKS